MDEDIRLGLVQYLINASMPKPPKKNRSLVDVSSEDVGEAKNVRPPPTQQPLVISSHNNDNHVMGQRL